MQKEVPDTGTVSQDPVKNDSFPPLLLSSTAKNLIRDYLKGKLLGDGDGCYIFRRFDRLIKASPVSSITRHFGPDVYETLESVEGVDSEIIKKSVEIKHKWFSGFAYGRQLRDEHANLVNKEIYLHSSNYSQLDTSLHYTFKFSDARQLTSHITPRRDDLIFIFISNKTLSDFAIDKDQGPKKKRAKPKADAWCIVSEQFLKAWTLIQYDWHDSFDKYIPIATPFQEREKILRDKLFIGNKLMTHSWLKHKLSLEAEGKVMSAEKSRETYWYLRTEYVSRKWVDVWCALVLIARYGELPCPVNVPNNSKGSNDTKIDTQHHRNVWSLPTFFVTMVLHKCLPSNFFISEHLINYDIWKDYSTSSMLMSIHGHPRGFFDDIHQVSFNSNTSSQNTNKDFTFPFLKLQFVAEEQNEDINCTDVTPLTDTWANIVKMGPRVDKKEL